MHILSLSLSLPLQMERSNLSIVSILSSAWIVRPINYSIT